MKNKRYTTTETNYNLYNVKQYVAYSSLATKYSELTNIFIQQNIGKFMTMDDWDKEFNNFIFNGGK